MVCRAGVALQAWHAAARRVCWRASRPHMDAAIRERAVKTIPPPQALRHQPRFQAVRTKFQTKPCRGGRAGGNLLLVQCLTEGLALSAVDAPIHAYTYAQPISGLSAPSGQHSLLPQTIPGTDHGGMVTQMRLCAAMRGYACGRAAGYGWATGLHRHSRSG